MSKNFDKIISVIDYLGDYDTEKYSITLYDVPNTKNVFNKIKSDIESITKKYKWIVLSPKQDYTNIKILDIDL